MSKNSKDVYSYFLKLLKNSIWFELFITALLVIILYKLIISNIKVKEGFTFMEKYIEKTDNEVFDDFYSNIYDELLFSDIKNNFELQEVSEIISKYSELSNNKNTKILDIGSGTGKHILDMKKIGLNVVGLDKSEFMVNLCKKNNPDVNVKLGDALTTSLFNNNEFTHITCFYFTIYYIDNKKLFLSNCYNWLKPGGMLILHLVNRDKFNPIVPAGDPFYVVSPQKYAKERITKTNVEFKDFNYKAEFFPVNSDNIALFKEKFKDNSSGNTRVNIHKLFMPTQKYILQLAKSVGFIEIAQIDMIACQYDNQYLYVLQKPN
jgi:ubiquinone/menaquinone biosynthesis C-methylase UbiE